MQEPLWMWLAFFSLVSLVLYVDLEILNRKSHAPSLREASAWCAAWVSLALLFGVGIYIHLGTRKFFEFLTGYVIEYSLSMDNMFVFIVIFDYFSVPPQYQPRVLHWGILGAVVMRLILIFAGVQLIHAFHGIVYVFGGILVFTGVKMALQKDQRIEPEKNPVLRIFKRFLPFVDRSQGEAFFVRQNSIWHATPLFATLLVVEASDLIFAIDSIPAILAITQDTFIVYTSNVFAILGLRSLFFLLAGIMGVFRFLKIGISVILCYVGAKMLLADIHPIPVQVSLGVVLGILTLSILASIAFKKKQAPHA
ncbi:MAG: TerC family protein [Elusimicrobia bacterium]|nr:TerC family protein [Elusimicrobiota bacterium]